MEDTLYNKYYYHVEDGQFSFDTIESELLGKVGETIYLDPWRDGWIIEVKIISIIENYIECVGNIEN